MHDLVIIYMHNKPQLIYGVLFEFRGADSTRQIVLYLGSWLCSAHNCELHNYKPTSHFMWEVLLRRTATYY